MKRPVPGEIRISAQTNAVFSTTSVLANIIAKEFRVIDVLTSGSVVVVLATSFEKNDRFVLVLTPNMRIGYAGWRYLMVIPEDA